MHIKRQKISPKSQLTIRPNNRKPKNNKLSNPKLRQKKIIFSPNAKYSYAKKHQLRRVKVKKTSYDSYRYKPLSEWKGLLKGHPVFILGNGPSIADQPLSLLDPYFSIGINRIFYLYSPTMLFWQDRELWRTNQVDILRCSAIRICRDITDVRGMFMNYKLSHNPFRFKNQTDRFYGRGNTGGLVVQLAVALKCSAVVLLGTDCKYASDGKTDFYGINKDHKDYTLRMCDETSEWLDKKCPVPLYNCSDNKTWPQISLKDAIKKLDPPKKNKQYFKKLFLK